eukprot:scaffold9514_cov35-Tisochrysis_lutea.AAC.1
MPDKRNSKIGNESALPTSIKEKEAQTSFQERCQVGVRVGQDCNELKSSESVDSTCSCVCLWVEITQAKSVDLTLHLPSAFLATTTLKARFGSQVRLVVAFVGRKD